MIIMIEGNALAVKSPVVKCINLFSSVKVLIPMVPIRSKRLICRLTVIRLMLSICWIVLYVVFNMWVALACLLG